MSSTAEHLDPLFDLNVPLEALGLADSQQPGAPYTITRWLTTSDEPEAHPLSEGATEATARRLAQVYQRDGYHVEIWADKDGQPVLVESFKPEKLC